MDTLSSQTTPIPAILPLPDVFLRSVHFLRRSFIHRYFLFNASDLHPFFFITSVDTHFYLMKLSVHRLSFTRTRLLFADGLRAGCTATPNVVRVSSDRMSDRRARDAGLDQRLASPGERSAKLHPLLTIRF